MSKIAFVILGLIFSAGALILLKLASTKATMSYPWIFIMAMSIGMYGIGFFIQSYLLRIFPLAFINPLMTIAVSLSAVLFGIFIFSESISIRQIIGIILGLVAIIFLVQK